MLVFRDYSDIMGSSSNLFTNDMLLVTKSEIVIWYDILSIG